MRRIFWLGFLLAVGLSGGCTILIDPTTTTEPVAVIDGGVTPPAALAALLTDTPATMTAITMTTSFSIPGNLIAVVGEGEPGSQVAILVDNITLITATVNAQSRWETTVYVDDMEHLLEVRNPAMTDIEMPDVIFRVETNTQSIERFLPESTIRPVVPGPPTEFGYATAAFVEQKFTPVTVFYATDRTDTGSSDPADKYGGQWSSRIELGTCIVTIPDTHQAGEIETPSIWAAEFSADPARHVILSAIHELEQDEFYARFNDRMAATGETFVFIHGFNVTFEDAARRTAQMAYDLGFRGAPVFYSWPSKGAYLGYNADGASIERSTPRLQRFLADVAAQTNAHTIHLIAHSMGNRGLTSALMALSTELPTAQLDKFNQIVLAAPDIDAEIFKEQIAPKIAPLGEQVTLYASSKDMALQLSRWMHDYPRAGESGERLVIFDGIYTIDASTVNTDFIGHNYPYGLTIVADIFEMFHDHDFPEDRFNLEMVETPVGKHWRFRRTQ